MSEEFMSHIFDSFTREEDSRTSKIQGTDLGMAITKNLIELMGGTITVKSKKGAGSTFTAHIPFQISQKQELQTVHAPSLQDQDNAQKGSIFAGKHILVAEDNALNAEIVEAMLEMAGATCRICENGTRALQAFLDSGPGQYDLIMMDVQMPEMNGYEASEAIRNSDHEMARTIPIIAMTANAFTEDIQNTLKAGMNAHVSKPLDMSILEKALRDVMSAGEGE